MKLYHKKHRIDIEKGVYYMIGNYIDLGGVFAKVLRQEKDYIVVRGVYFWEKAYYYLKQFIYAQRHYFS